MTYCIPLGIFDEPNFRSIQILDNSFYTSGLFKEVMDRLKITTLRGYDFGDFIINYAPFTGQRVAKGMLEDKHSYTIIVSGSRLARKCMNEVAYAWRNLESPAKIIKEQAEYLEVEFENGVQTSCRALIGDFPHDGRDMDLGAILPNPVEYTPTLSTDSLLETVAAWKYRRHRDPEWTPRYLAPHLELLFAAFHGVWKKDPLLAGVESLDIGVGTKKKRRYDNDTFTEKTEKTEETDDESLHKQYTEAVQKRQRNTTSLATMADDAAMQDVDTTEEDLQHTVNITLEMMSRMGSVYTIENLDDDIFETYHFVQSQRRETNSIAALSQLAMEAIPIHELLQKLTIEKLKVYFDTHVKKDWLGVVSSKAGMEISIRADRVVDWEFCKFALADATGQDEHNQTVVSVPQSLTLQLQFYHIDSEHGLWRPTHQEFFWPEFFSLKDVKVDAQLPVVLVMVDPMTRLVDKKVDVMYLANQFKYHIAARFSEAMSDYWKHTKAETIRLKSSISAAWDSMPLTLFDEATYALAYYTSLVGPDNNRSNLWRNYLHTFRDLYVTADHLDTNQYFVEACIGFLFNCATQIRTLSNNDDPVVFTLHVRVLNAKNLKEKPFWNLMVLLQTHKTPALKYDVLVRKDTQTAIGNVTHLHHLKNRLLAPPQMLGIAEDLTPLLNELRYRFTLAVKINPL